jgi:molybdate transport system regulatory protein
MNTLEGKIEKITTKNNLTLVGIKVGDVHLSAIVIDTPETVPHLKEGNAIHVIFKETEVILGSGKDHHISLQNKLEGYVDSIETGDLLSRLILDTTVGKIVSVITTNAVNQLQLKRGSEITAMIKTNEMMLQHD